MAGRIPDETLNAIRERISLVEVISPFVRLRRAGRDFIGLCPFHSEKSPSFSVSEERGLFYCFGCGAGGTAIQFLMRIERLSFPEAVEQLAERAGVDLPKRPDSAPQDDARERLFRVNQGAARFYRAMLERDPGRTARRYLAERGLSEETIERYGLGFAPLGGRALVSWLGQHGVSPDVAVRLGLAGQGSGGRTYDRFRNRIVFPIRDRRGRVIGFGGRALDDDGPKYLNSPESPLFQKGRNLYGIEEAREAIRRENRVVVVEGYMDALVLAQHGFPYAVAALGTSLTAAQLGLLRPFGGDGLEILLFFDGDRAGERAAMRAFGVCAEAGVWGNAVFLPEGEDPDSFVRRYGDAATRERIDSAQPLVDYFLDRMAPAGSSLEQRDRAARETAAVLARVREDSRFELLAARASERLGVSEHVFRAARGRAPVAHPPIAPEPAAAPAPRPPAEMLLVELLVADSQVREEVAGSGVTESFTDPELARLAADLIERAGEPGGVAAVLAGREDDLVGRLSAGTFRRRAEEGDFREMARECIARIRKQAWRSRLRMLQEEVRRAEAAGDLSACDRWLRELDEHRERYEAMEGP